MQVPLGFFQIDIYITEESRFTNSDLEVFGKQGPPAGNENIEIITVVKEKIVPRRHCKQLNNNRP